MSKALMEKVAIAKGRELGKVLKQQFVVLAMVM